ncbi:response regulator [Gemmata sp. G18]|uniref:Response regulator n=1 Tax=Gemmata palustris TaxID=2822762 RepID=A0ABS5BUG2_9BACT|nr:response regulator [Gemmata palustris]MBP3957319.1 response regulator [Gemmata palustris]
MPAPVGALVDTPPAPLYAPGAPKSTAQAVPTILLVDDSSVQRRIVHSLLDGAGTWNVVHAADGVSALQQIEREQPDLVLTDVYMPKMDGLALVEQVRDRFPGVPVVLMTGHGSEQVAVSALKAGAADYVPKRAMVSELGRILERVLTNARTESDRVRLFSGMTGRVSRFVLDNDPRLIGPLVAQIRDDLLAVGVCNRNGVTRVGIALEEALLNAIYHGNLEVSSQLKENGDGPFCELAHARRTQAPYAARRVRVVARVTPRRAMFVVADEGPGFDVNSLPDPATPELLERPSGRGLLLMRSFMDQVRFNAIGNRVTLVKSQISCTRDD